MNDERCITMVGKFPPLMDDGVRESRIQIAISRVLRCPLQRVVLSKEAHLIIIYSACIASHAAGKTRVDFTSWYKSLEPVDSY
jgi:hypothetical protein